MEGKLTLAVCSHRLNLKKHKPTYAHYRMYFENSSAAEIPRFLFSPHQPHSASSTQGPGAGGGAGRGQRYVVGLSHGAQVVAPASVRAEGGGVGVRASLGLSPPPLLCREEAGSSPALADLGLAASVALLSRTRTDGWHPGRAEHPAQDWMCCPCVLRPAVALRWVP